MEVTFPLVSKIAILSFIPLAIAGAVFFAFRDVLLIFVGNSEMCCVIIFVLYFLLMFSVLVVAVAGPMWELRYREDEDEDDDYEWCDEDHPPRPRRYEQRTYELDRPSDRWEEEDDRRPPRRRSRRPRDEEDLRPPRGGRRRPREERYEEEYRGPPPRRSRRRPPGHRARDEYRRPPGRRRGPRDGY